MKFINWIKSLFAPKPLEPVQDGWRGIVKRLTEDYEIERRGIEKAKKMQAAVRSTRVGSGYVNPPPAPKAPPTRYISESPVRKQESTYAKSTDDDWMTNIAAAYVVSTVFSDPPASDDNRSSYSSDSSSSSSDSFSGGGGSFDGGGSSGDW